MQLGDAQSAEIEMRKAMNSGHDPVSGELFVIDALIAQDQYDRARDLHGQMVEKTRSDRDVHAWLIQKSRLELADGRKAAARGTLEKALELVPLSVKAQIAMAKVEAADGNADAAERIIRQALKSDAKSADAWLVLGRLQHRGGDIPSAIDSYSKIIELRPFSRAARWSRALCYLSQRDYVKAEADASVIAKVSAQDPAAFFVRGLSKFMQRDIAGAVSELQEANALAPDFIEANYYLGLAYLVSGQDESALGTLRMVANSQKVPGRARFYLAVAQLRVGDLTSAESSLDHVLAIYADDPDAARLKANLALLGQRDEEAVRVMEEALLNRVGTADDFFHFGIGLAGIGREHEAIAAFDKARELSGKLHAGEVSFVLKLIADKRFSVAAGQIDKLAARTEEKWLVHSLTGTLLAEQGQDQEAREEFDRAWRLNPGNPVVGRSLAAMAIAEQNFDVALSYLQTIADKHSSDVGVALEYAEVLARANRTDESISEIQRATKIAPAEVKPWLLLLRAELSRGTAEGAAELIGRIPDIVKKDSEFMLGAADAYAGVGRYDESRRFFEQAVNRRPDSTSTRIRMGQMLLNAGSLDAARSRFIEAAEIRPSSVDALAGLTQVEINAGNIGKAEGYLQRIRRLEGSEAVAALMAARIAGAKGDADSQLSAYAHLHQLHPTRKNSAIYLRLLAGAGQVGKAIEVAENWLAVDPGAQEVRFLLGALCEQIGDTRQAIAVYGEHLERHPNDPLVLNNLALLLQRQDRARAIELAERAVAASNNDFRILDTYGWLLVGGGEVQAGLDKLTEAYRNSSGNPEIGYHLAAAYHAVGEHGRAQEILALHDYRGHAVQGEVDRLNASILAAVGR